MKDFIITIAIFPLIMWFTCQFTVEQVNHAKIVAFIAIVNKHSETARQDGCFTADNINNLKIDLSKAFYIKDTDVSFTGDTVPKTHTDTFNRVQMIHFKVSVPIKNFLADSSFWGISQDKNVINYSFDNEVPSELLPTS